MKRNFFILFFIFLFLFSMTSCYKKEDINTPTESTKIKSQSSTSIDTTENDFTPSTSSEESSVYALPDEVDIAEEEDEEYDEDLYYGEESIEDFADKEDSDNEKNTNTSNDNIEDNVSNNNTNKTESNFTDLNENH